MAHKKKTKETWVQPMAHKMTIIQFLYLAAYMGLIIVFDSWNLIPHEAVGQRWTLAASLLVLTTILWYGTRMKLPNPGSYKLIIALLLISDIALAAMNVYWERGMASISVGLFAVPIVLAASLRSKGALLSTASLSTAAYSVAVVRYFNDNYGEGFRVQLYGIVAFYTAIFFILAWALIMILHPSEKKP